MRTNENYSYDPLGNILTKSVMQASSTQLSTYKYDGKTGTNYANPHAVTSIQTLNGGTATSTQMFFYDKRGNTVTIQTRDAKNVVITDTSKNFSWNQENQLIKTLFGSSTTGTKLTYTYDVSGERLSQVTPSSTTIYPSPSYNLTRTASGTVMDVEKHLYASDFLAATVQGSGSSSKAFFDHTDHLSGANAISNEAGNLEELVDYTPFGSIRFDRKRGAFSEQKKYAGQEFDSTTGLSYMHARYYDPAIGRFLSVDPVSLDLSFDPTDPQTANAYAYARNNPIRYTDPTGRTYAEGVQGYGSGLANGVWETVKALGNAIRHPVDTIVDAASGAKDAVATAAKAWVAVSKSVTTNSTQAIQEAKDGAVIATNEFLAKPDYEKGKTIGLLTEKGMELVVLKKMMELSIKSSGSVSSGVDVPEGKSSLKGDVKDWQKITNPPQPPPAIPNDYQMTLARSGKGVVFRPPGAANESSSLRIMEPTNQYPNGYWRQTDANGFPVNPSTGLKSPNKGETHIPLPANFWKK